MSTSTLVKTDRIEIGGQTYSVRYFETKTDRGTVRYSSEVVLAPADRIILDGSSLFALESKVVRLVPATLAARGVAA